MTRVLLALLLALTPAGALPAQVVRTAVVPEAITVGDVFHAVIRVSGAGERPVQFPDTLALPPDLEAAGRRELRRDTVNGGLEWTAIYPLAGFRPGRHTLSVSEVRVATGAAVRSAPAAFPEIVIRSVLPADTAGIEPKPAKDVLGGNRVWWPILLGLALLIALLAALLWWWRRRRARPVPDIVVPALPARERALAALDAARTSGAVEAGDLKRFYSEVSEALRAYVATLDPRFGTDLTTTELTHSLRAAGLEVATGDLRRVLEGADLVKFARRRPSDVTAIDEWQRARDFVVQFQEPVEPAEARAA